VQQEEGKIVTSDG